MDSRLKGLLQEIQRDLENVERFEFLSGPDSGGDPAVWVWAVLPSDPPEEAWSWENRQRIRFRVHDELREAGVSDWVYVYFRGADEEAPADFVHST